MKKLDRIQQTAICVHVSTSLTIYGLVVSLTLTF